MPSSDSILPDAEKVNLSSSSPISSLLRSESTGSGLAINGGAGM